MDRRFIEPLLNRPYIEGVQDCYKLVMDFYKLNYNIKLPNFARPTHIWGSPNDQLWVNLGKHANFDLLHCPTPLMRVGDVLGMAVQSNHINHLGIYIGDGMFIHHVYKKHSEVTRLTHGWQNLIMVKARHTKLGEILGYGQR